MIDCTNHGPSGAAFVCGHSLDAYREQRKQSLYWSESDEQCAWCEECNQRYLEAGENWSGDAEEMLDAKLLCIQCLRDMMKFNGYN